MERTYEKTVIKSAHPTMNEKNTVVHTEKPAAGEIDNLAAEQQAAGGILESVKAAAMAGVETVKDGVNYIAEQISAATATDTTTTTTTPSANSTTTTQSTTITPNKNVNPQVQKHTEIVKEQTTYPNQSGYGVNQKFKEDNKSGAIDDIKSGLKKAGENIKEAAVNFKEDVKDGANAIKDTAKDVMEDAKIEANRMSQPKPQKHVGLAGAHGYETTHVKTTKTVEHGQQNLAHSGAQMHVSGEQMKMEAEGCPNATLPPRY
jgi:hypothetical protein